MGVSTLKLGTAPVAFSVRFHSAKPIVDVTLATVNRRFTGDQRQANHRTAPIKTPREDGEDGNVTQRKHQTPSAHHRHDPRLSDMARWSGKGHFRGYSAGGPSHEPHRIEPPGAGYAAAAFPGCS